MSDGQGWRSGPSGGALIAGAHTLVLGEREYRWQELTVEGAAAGWAHHGVAVLEDGTVVASAPDQAVLVELDGTGRERRRAPVDLVEMHGMRPTGAGPGTVLWVADNGHKFVPGRPTYGEKRAAGRALAVDLDGQVRLELAVPQIEAYERAAWSPCAVAVDEERAGGTGDIWVADGYGQSLLHRYSAAGQWLATIDGSATGTVFATPHDVIIDRRRAVPELYVADRGNRRVVVLDLQGNFRRTVGDGALTSPSGLAVANDILFVAELHGRLVALDASDQLIAPLGAHDDHERPGWPNEVDARGNVARVHDLRPLAFNSPHGLAVDAGGAVYVSEWLIGGRLVRLAPLP